nr:PREDICTED: uncharacterized protein LOC103314709 isoform X3 [Tribolium castaneum]XP_015837230.1 PREDICTED: uncharacterized protein LOC103314709 isoform X3 [Tribolium castaneum]XP_015837231.1 PREDICTED: uncharacterized protein LOC103314709 isoform X3 [Tribolium castaneum]|eukprot:XP_015837225.1 PREDICTED: uncharacterized protein LOC103314709 isoform X3 [Tribolium castaneum]
MFNGPMLIVTTPHYNRLHSLVHIAGRRHQQVICEINLSKIYREDGSQQWNLPLDASRCGNDFVSSDYDLCSPSFTQLPWILFADINGRTKSRISPPDNCQIEASIDFG